MKAAQLTRYGDKNSIAITEADKPQPADDEILVKVEAFAINPFDGKLRQGFMQDFIPLRLPAILGSDVVGTVEAVGAKVKKFKPGDKILGAANSVSGHGSFAEFAPVSQRQAVIMPDDLSYIEAAGIPLAGASAYQALTEHLNLQAGQKILIHGGAGGIGMFAIQLAKNIGAEVAATVSADAANLAKQLGADTVIDYAKSDFSSVIKEYDAVLDTVGGDTAIKSYQVLKRGGRLVSLVSEPDQELMKVNQVTAYYQFTKPTSDKLQALVDLASKGKIKVLVDREFSFDQTAEALEYAISGHPRGKVVVRLR